MRSIKKSIARVFIIPPFLLLAHFIHCDAGSGFLGPQTFPYVCQNGTADISRATTVENTEKCTACDQGYRLLDESCRLKGTIKEAFPYVCPGGTASTNGMSTRSDTERCTRCNSGYRLQGDLTCVRVHPYVCDNGTAAQGTTDTEGAQKCMSCATGYALQPDETCQNFPFTCPSGSPTAGTSTTQNFISCHSCDTNYELYTYDRNSNTACRRVYPYICTNGTIASGTIHIENTEKCSACNSRFHAGKRTLCISSVNNLPLRLYQRHYRFRKGCRTEHPRVQRMRHGLSSATRWKL